jgi:hypothetical protein
VLFTLFEKLIPTFDQFTFCLVFNQLKFVDSPTLFNSIYEILKDCLASSLSKYILDYLTFSKKICRPEITKMEFRLFGTNLKARKHFTPMLLFHGIASELLKDFIDFFVAFYVINISLVDLILSHLVREFTHLIHFEI